MPEAKRRAETDADDASLEREVSVSRYPGCEPVTVRTTRVPGEERNREERMRVGLQRLLREGRISLGS